MLVLTRKRFETIQIGDNVKIKVIKTGKSSVKIGIDAPDNIRVARGEICKEPAMVQPLDEKTLNEVCAMHTAAYSDQYPHAV